jgi:putative ABC transport system permease protein
LTTLSVAIAVFLFATLQAVLDGFDAVAAASSSTRVVTIRSTSMIFPMPTSHVETIRSTPGVQDATWANWFGGIYKDPKNFFGQFAIDPESYLRLYPEVIPVAGGQEGFMEDRTGCIVGEGWRRNTGWSLARSQSSSSRGIPVYGSQDLRSQFRGIYKAWQQRRRQPVDVFIGSTPTSAACRRARRVGSWPQVAGPRSRVSRWRSAIDQRFANSPYETKTDTEEAFSPRRSARCWATLDSPARQSVALAVVNHDPVRRRQHEGQGRTRAGRRRSAVMRDPRGSRRDDLSRSSWAKGWWSRFWAARSGRSRRA